ncbi:unnamed protein product [Mesocestoides corti]|uniref:EGF-like domain-containing protein n=1 Tax=Mesocestoides corti TaxID=53468 RepID=A0A3P6HVP6_MESCO|nr:unnamed protein product [Mesocestoides corti]
MQDGASMLDSDFACIGSITSDVPVYGNGIQKTAFVGRLSQLNLNGLDLIRIIGGTAAYRAKESIHNPHDSHLVTLLSTWKENFEVTAVSANAERIRAFPLQFQGDGGLLTYSLNQEACVSVSFAMKTSALYLCIDDIPSLMIEVDGVKFVPKDLAGSLTVPRHAPDKLYFGGLPQEHTRRLRNYFRSSHGYDGCFADLNVTQKSIQETSNKAEKSNVRVFQHPVNSHRITQEARGIKLGCKFPQKQAIDKIWNVNSAPTICQPGLCGFGGRCVQQLDTYYCDCSMSGFSGPVCTDVATAIRYSGNGCAVFEFNPMRNTSRDAISFGLQTLRKSPATLLHITSHSNSLDFLRLEITPFRERLVLRLTYNMGSGIQTIQEPNVDLSDGMFHVVRVIRDNAHLQLQVDSGKVINATTKGMNFLDAKS